MILIVVAIPRFQNFNSDIPFLGRFIGWNGEFDLEDITFMYMLISKSYINHLLIEDSIINQYSVFKTPQSILKGGPCFWARCYLKIV